MLVFFDQHCYVCGLPVSARCITSGMSAVRAFAELIVVDLPVSVRRAFDKIVVACREGTCVWIGNVSALDAHTCPVGVHEADDVQFLQHLFYSDERISVKVAVLHIVGRRVVNPRTAVVNVPYLTLMYSYLRRFRKVTAIQVAGFNVLRCVANVTGGVCAILRYCPGLLEYLRSMRSPAELWQYARPLADTLDCAESMPAAHVLCSFVRNRT